jgi:hypothetical protein
MTPTQSTKHNDTAQPEIDNQDTGSVKLDGNLKSKLVELMVLADCTSKTILVKPL